MQKRKRQRGEQAREAMEKKRRRNAKMLEITRSQLRGEEVDPSLIQQLEEEEAEAEAEALLLLPQASTEGKEEKKKKTGTPRYKKAPLEGGMLKPQLIKTYQTLVDILKDKRPELAPPSVQLMIKDLSKLSVDELRTRINDLISSTSSDPALQAKLEKVIAREWKEIKPTVKETVKEMEARKLERQEEKTALAQCSMTSSANLRLLFDLSQNVDTLSAGGKSSIRPWIPVTVDTLARTFNLPGGRGRKVVTLEAPFQEIHTFNIVTLPQSGPSGMRIILMNMIPPRFGGPSEFPASISVLKPPSSIAVHLHRTPKRTEEGCKMFWMADMPQPVGEDIAQQGKNGWELKPWAKKMKESGEPYGPPYFKAHIEIPEEDLIDRLREASDKLKDSAESASSSSSLSSLPVSARVTTGPPIASFDDTNEFDEFDEYDEFADFQ